MGPGDLQLRWHGRVPPPAGPWAEPAAAGWFSPRVPPGQVCQVLGTAFAAWWAEATPDRKAAWRDALPVGAILVEADGLKTPDLPAWLPARGFLGRTGLPAHEVVFALRQGLGETSAPLAGVHGVFVRIFGLGVLLLGASGIGKSELALELVTRGHRLVADDHVDIRRPAPGVLTGACPPGLAGVIEVRGLGFLDLGRMFGPARVDPRPCRLDLAIRLEQGEWQLSATERLAGRRGTWELHGTGVPILTLPFRLGHNPAVLVEAACRDQWLRLHGFDAGQMLMERLMPPTSSPTPPPATPPT